ncbi:MAG: DNA repair protein RecO, partial [Syntrophales bacterium]|nr:DNA repair protein RecO [Syntrophales bacterium]
MGAKTTYRTDAIVLKSNDYGEADQIVSFYTREFGKMKGIAKGARRSRRRFVNALDIFWCSRLTFTRRSPGGLAFLDDCTVVHHFEDVRNSVEKTATAFYLVELIEAFTMEGKPNNALYEFLTEAMDLINEKDCHEGITRFLETRILMLSGHDPVLD